MMKTFLRAVLFVGLAAVAGCSTDPGATADIEGNRAPLAGQGTNTLNSPTAGPTNAGADPSNQPELDPNRGKIIY